MHKPSAGCVTPKPRYGKRGVTTLADGMARGMASYARHRDKSEAPDAPKGVGRLSGG